MITSNNNPHLNKFSTFLLTLYFKLKNNDYETCLLQNLQKAVRKCIKDSSEDMELLIDQFERKVVGVLPI